MSGGDPILTTQSLLLVRQRWRGHIARAPGVRQVWFFVKRALSPPRSRRGQQHQRVPLDRNVRVLSLEIFGTALYKPVLERADLHHLVASAISRHYPEVARNYPALRIQAEAEARASAKAEGCPAPPLARILDHLEALLGQAEHSAPADVIAQAAVDRELTLEQILSRPDPDAVALFEEARERGITTALITDSHLPRDLIARILEAANFTPDHLLVASNEGVTKETGLFERLLSVTKAKPSEVVHLGPSQAEDVEEAAGHGIRGHLAPNADVATTGLFDLGLTPRSGVDSIALGLAASRFARRGPDKSLARDIGYYAGGPLAAGFAAWVTNRIREQKPERVLFCGPGGELLRRVTTTLRPGLSPGRMTTFPTADTGSSLFQRLDRLEEVLRPRSGAGILLVETSLEGPCHPLIQDWARASGRSLDITSLRIGLGPSDDRRNTEAWAFGGTNHCPVEERLSRRPEIVEALLRSFPSSPRDLPPALRSFHAIGREVEAGVVGFAEDFEPWIRLDYRGTTPALAEPALRVISDPTPAEAAVLGGYPGWNSGETVGAVPLAVAPRRRRRRPKGKAPEAESALWPEGLRALTASSPSGR